MLIRVIYYFCSAQLENCADLSFIFVTNKQNTIAMKTIKSILLSLTLLITANMLFALSNLFAQSNEAHIEQVGTFHEGYIQQEPGTVSGGSNSGNFPGNGFEGSPPGVPFQDNEGFNGLHSASYAEILQYESSNVAAILQAGSHWAQISQLGLNNLASILQEGGSGDSFSFNPPGVANPCPPPFAPCDGSSDGGSTASIYQEGDRNDASIEQKDGSNEAKIVQYGSDLEAIIHQYGDENYASILQDFTGVSLLSNMAGFRTTEILQTNNSNVATVEQSVPTQLPIQIFQDGNMEIHVEHHTYGADEWWVN